MPSTTDHRALLLVAVLACAAACSPKRKVEPVGSVYVVEADVVAADGATLEVTAEDSAELAGTRLVIPPGALVTDTHVTITIGTDIPDDGSTPAGPTVELGPLGTLLNPPAELTLPLSTVPQPALARVYARDADRPHPTRLPDSLAIGTENGAPVVRLEIDTLLAYQPAAATNACSGRTCPPDSACRNGGCYPACNTTTPLRRILFLVDQTPSMATSDPTSARLDAVVDVIDSFVDPETSEIETGVAFAILGFWGDAVVHTESSPGVVGFSSDGVAVKAAVTELGTAQGNEDETRYDHALAEASALLEADMAALEPEERARVIYQVMVITDGPPAGAACDGEANAPASAVRRVEILVETAAFHDVSLEVSSAWVADPTRFSAPHDAGELACMKLDRAPFDGDCETAATTGDVTRCVLDAMARAGGGSLSTFSETNPVDFGAVDFEPAISTPCPDGFECRLSHSLCVPRTADDTSSCVTDQDCAFRSVCVGGSCIADEFGCGNDCLPSEGEPLKVLFAFDASTALATADPLGKARRAIDDTVRDMLRDRPHTAFRILGFHAETQPAPPGTTGCAVFSRHQTSLKMATDAMSTGNLLDLQGVLNVARADLRRDMAGVAGHAGCELTRDDDELSRTHYVVVLVTAGLPGPTCALGFDNDFDPVLPTEPYALCDDAAFASCVVKRDLDEGAISCDAVYGTCAPGGAPRCAYDGNLDSTCCDSDYGWDGIGTAPHERLFGGLAGESELRGGDPYNQPLQLDARVRALVALREQYDVGSIRLHTVRVPPASDPDLGRELMERLAATGRGFPLAFPGAEGITFATLGLENGEGSEQQSTCADRIPPVTCGTPPPSCPAGTYPEHSELQATECGLIATWTGACLPC